MDVILPVKRKLIFLFLLLIVINLKNLYLMKSLCIVIYVFTQYLSMDTATKQNIEIVHKTISADKVSKHACRFFGNPISVYKLKRKKLIDYGNFKL